MILKALKLLHHLKGKLKDGKIAATAGYAENSLVMSVSLINSINLTFISFYICILALFLFFYVNISLFYCIILYMGCCK